MATATLAKKRKHEEVDDGGAPANLKARQRPGADVKKKRPLQTETQPLLERNGSSPAVKVARSEYISIQIVTGSYDRGILHGITASISSHFLDPSKTSKPQQEINGTTENGEQKDVTFSDNFLFAAHTSSIRCLGISGPSETGRRSLATGGSDERINLYSLSTAAPPPASNTSQATTPALPSLSQPPTTIQNPKNRSLGNLLHHDRAITRLHFPPNTNKLFSAAEDNNIAITRARDWTLLSSIRAPIPKPTGRPSGDTAAPGEVPAGVNDFAIHPSQKLMLSVGRGERCLRLWNLMTGKKAGVLNFDREVLAQAGEGKFSTGEGRRVVWSEDGEVYVVVFERGAVVYGLDSRARAVIRPSHPTKLHQVKVLPKTDDGAELLAISTEDGRILFFDLNIQNATDAADAKNDLPHCKAIAQLGGRAAGVSGRIKDFEVLQVPSTLGMSDLGSLVVTASSDGAIRLWSLSSGSLPIPTVTSNGTESKGYSQKQVGTLIATLETGSRITCLGSFVMDGTPEANGHANEPEEFEDAASEGDEDDADSENGSWDGFDGE